MRAKRIFDKRFTLNKILICLVVGSMLGAILANGMNQLSCSKVNLMVQNFFSDNLPSLSTNKIDLFRSEFFKHSKIVLFIWLMAFIPLGNFFLMIVLFLKGVSYGFTSSVLFSIYKLKAAAKIIKYILPQNFILLPVFIFISFCSMNYIFKSSLKHKFDKANIFEHFFVLIISLLCVFLSSLIEFYFV